MNGESGVVSNLSLFYTKPLAGILDKRSQYRGRFVKRIYCCILLYTPEVKHNLCAIVSDYLKYKIDVNKEVIFHVFTGNVRMADIQEFLKELVSDPEYSKFFDQVVDFRFCNLLFSIKELPELVTFVKEEIKINAARKEVYLTNKPNEVVLGTIFRELVKELQVDIAIVSTIERIIELLLKPALNENILENTLDELRMTTANT